MITSADSLTTVALEAYYAILPNHPDYDLDKYCNAMGADLVPPGFSYNSGNNEVFLTVEQLRKLIQQHVAAGLS